MIGNENFVLKRKEFRYDRGHKSPFLVIIEKKDDDKESPQTNRFVLAKKLINNNVIHDSVKKGYGLRYAGRNRFKIHFTGYNWANTFVEKVNEVVCEFWEAYIPEFRIFKTFVLYGIDDLNISEEEVKVWLGSYRGEGEFPEIISVERMKRWVPSDADGTQGKLIDTRNFKVKFRTTEVAERATFMMTTVYLKQYVENRKRCNFCLRYGHVQKFCRDVGNDNKRVCSRCAEFGHSDKECSSAELKCVNCIKNKLINVGHNAKDKNCPILIFNKDVKKIIAEHNVDRKMAVDLLNKNEGVPPRKKQSYEEVVKNFIDMENFLRLAKEKKQMLKEKKEQRMIERRERKKKLEELRESKNREIQEKNMQLEENKIEISVKGKRKQSNVEVVSNDRVFQENVLENKKIRRYREENEGVRSEINSDDNSSRDEGNESSFITNSEIISEYEEMDKDDINIDNENLSDFVGFGDSE